MEPPGKKSGWTTKESVESARRAPAHFEDSGVAEIFERGIAEGGQEEMLDEFVAELAAAAVTHDDGGVVGEGQRTGPVRKVGSGCGLARFGHFLVPNF